MGAMPKPLTVGESVLQDLVRLVAAHKVLDEGLFRRYAREEKIEIYGSEDLGTHIHSIVASMYYWEWRCGGVSTENLQSWEAARRWHDANANSYGRNIPERLRNRNSEPSETVT